MHAKFDDFSYSRSRDIIGGIKSESGSRDPDHAPFKDNLSSWCWDLTKPTCTQNLTTLASAVPDIWLVPFKISVVHVTWPRSF